MRKPIERKQILRITLINLVLILFLTTCQSHIPVSTPQSSSERLELESYRRSLQIISDGKLGDPSISIGFIDIKYRKNKAVLGTCNWFFVGVSYRINITKESWIHMNRMERILLLAHEYGHCQCKKVNHIDTKFLDGCPKHYMSSYMQSALCFNRHGMKYIDQIRRGCDEFDKQYR